MLPASTYKDNSKVATHVAALDETKFKKFEGNRTSRVVF